jgi:hypothetical protein
MQNLSHLDTDWSKVEIRRPMSNLNQYDMCLLSEPTNDARRKAKFRTFRAQRELSAESWRKEERKRRETSEKSAKT